MLENFIKAGQKIDLKALKRVKLSGEENKDKIYTTKVYDVVDDDTIEILMPMEQTKLVLLPVDGEYSMCFYTPNGLYQCIARVVERYKSNNLFVLAMELETDLQRYQRREYYRLNIVLDMKCRPIDEKTDVDPTEQVKIYDTDLTFDNGIMVDISGGGARFISTVQYQEGELVKELLEDYDGKESGLITTFKPSKKVLGTDRIPIEMLMTWLSEFNYTLPSGIDMTYTGYTVKHKELYQFFADHRHEVIIPEDDRLCNNFTFTCSGNLVEEVLGKSYDRTFNIEAVIIYADPDKYKGEDIKHSWMNMIHTSQNGDHVDGVIRGFSKFIKGRVVAKNKKLEGVNIKRDIEAHMSIVVRGTCNCANMFSAQAKQTVVSKELGKAIEEATIDALSKMNSSTINEIVDVIIGNYRARIEGEKMRNVTSQTKGLKSWQKPDSYYPCASIKTPEPKELFLVEGNSAGGGLKGARNARYQAILTFKGKSLNVWDLTLDRALQSIPWLNLVNVLGCGVGSSFDIKKLNFDKIIIATDADIDGYHIRVGICAFFVKFLPEIIRAGKLYIAEPPLYKLSKDKDVYYVASQTEYLQKCVESIGGIDLEFPEMK